MKKNWFSRKFLAMMIGLLFIWGNYDATLAAEPTILTAQSFWISVACTIILVFLYAGGNLLSDFIHSKYFNPILAGVDPKPLPSNGCLLKDASKAMRLKDDEAPGTSSGMVAMMGSTDLGGKVTGLKERMTEQETGG